MYLHQERVALPYIKEPINGFLSLSLNILAWCSTGGAGRLREALIIYIHVLHDLEAALKYCHRVAQSRTR